MFFDQAFFEMVAWAGTLFYALHCLPQCRATWIDGKCALDSGYLGLWFMGAVCSIPYTVYMANWPVVCAQSISFVCLLMLIYFKVFPRQERALCPLPGK